MNEFVASLLQIAEWSHGRHFMGASLFFFLLTLAGIEATVIGFSAGSHRGQPRHSGWRTFQLRSMVTFNILLCLAIAMWIVVIGSMYFLV